MHVIGKVVGNVETSCFNRGANGNADYDSRFVKNENGTCQDAGSKGVVCRFNASCDWAALCAEMSRGLHQKGETVGDAWSSCL